MSDPVRVASLNEVPPGQPQRVDLGGARVVLVRLGDAVYACGDVCAHKGSPLSEGKLTGHRLACPWHGWLYDVRTGQCVFPGRGASAPSYKARIEGNDIWVEAS